MKKSQREAVCQKFTRRTKCNLAVAKIPTRNVVAWIANHFNAIEEGRDQITPFLIDKQAFHRFVIAVCVQAVCPPPGKSSAFVIVTDADKAQVVGSQLQRTYFVVEYRSLT